MRRFRPWVFAGVLVLMLLACMGFAAPIDLAFNLLFGWVFFLGRVPDVRINGGGILTAMVCLTVLSVGMHRFLSWLHGQMQAEAADSSPGRWKRSWTATLITIFLLMFISGLTSVGVAHQAGWLLTAGDPFLWSGSGSSAARRAQSVNNLKQTAVALNNYHEAMASFPPGGIFDPQGRAYHGWQAMLLSQSEEKVLYNQINFDVPWNDRRNTTSFRTVVNHYLNPGVRPETKDRAGFAPSHYAGNAHVLGGDVARTLKDIPDGESQTIMAGEVAAGFKPWGSPTNWRDPAQGVNRSHDGFGSPFPGGANFSLVDGSVRFIKSTVDPRIMKALGTPRGGEVISADAY